MNNFQKRKVATPKKISYNRYCKLKHKQQEREFQKQVKRSNITTLIFVLPVLIGLLIFSVLASVNHMHTIDYSMGLLTLILMPTLICFAMYWIIKISIHGFSDF